MNQTDLSSVGFLQDSRTILVVEDEADTKTLFADALQAEIPYHFLFVKNAARALETLKTIIPHLLILDSARLGMSGLEFYQYLQSQRQFRHVPVLLLGTKDTLQEMENRHIPCLQKPFKLDNLLQKMRELV